ncbi:unnamed protein product [Allacma fusca]|uniref:C2H2-type domain-containing protein n=1 Tax=Allacma fusca TaxID=39272 RepID=A0A8J2PFH7_9HEXA|nr:unnamed protein product [Allacma fusca]
MTTTNGVKSYFTKYSKSDDYQFEADSSAISDDGCVHDDDCSSYVITSSEDEDSQSSEEVVSSNPQQHFNRREKKDEDTEDFPTSTTMDDEDYDDMVIPHPVNTRCITRPSRFLKRSYHQMRNSGSSHDGPRGDEEVEDTDTDDEEVKGYCFTQGGLERLRMFQLNRLKSHASSSSPNRLKDDWENLRNTQQQAHEERRIETSTIIASTKHIETPVNLSTTHTGSFKKVQGIRKKPCNNSAWLEMISRPTQRTKKGYTCQTKSSDATNKDTLESFIHNQLDKTNASNILVVDNHTKDTSHNRMAKPPGFNSVDGILSLATTKSINRCSPQMKDSIQEPCIHQQNANISDENIPMYKCPSCDLTFEEKQTFNSHLNNCQAHKSTSKIEERELN